MAKRQKHNYVDNKKFLLAMIEYREVVVNSTPDSRPRVPFYIGDCIMKIATHLSYKANFINYTYRDDMISDGIENCLVAVNKFDPSKSSNPFAYYTQIIYFAFVRRIQKEKKQQDTKYKMMENIDFDKFLSNSDGNEEYVNYLIDLMQKHVDNVNSDRSNK